MPVFFGAVAVIFTVAELPEAMLPRLQVTVLVLPPLVVQVPWDGVSAPSEPPVSLGDNFTSAAGLGPALATVTV